MRVRVAFGSGVALGVGWEARGRGMQAWHWLASSTLIAFFAEVSRKGIETEPANSFAASDSTCHEVSARLW